MARSLIEDSIKTDMSACVQVFQNRVGLVRWQITCSIFVTDPPGYRKLKLGEPIGLVGSTERDAIINGDGQPAY